MILLSFLEITSLSRLLTWVSKLIPQAWDKPGPYFVLCSTCRQAARLHQNLVGIHVTYTKFKI